MMNPPEAVLHNAKKLLKTKGAAKIKFGLEQTGTARFGF